MLRRFLRPIPLLVVLFIAVWISVAFQEMARPADAIFQSDASQYNAGAVHLLQSGFYSLDGVHPFTEREPGQSFFLAAIYAIFGAQNRWGIFFVQGLLHLIASLVFSRQLRKLTSSRAALVTLGFLLFLPSVFHVIFSPNRESLALSLFLLFSSAFLSLLQRDSRRTAAAAGVSLGCLVLTYIPFLFFPLFLLPFVRKLPWRSTALVVCIPLVMCLAWAARNAFIGDTFQLTGSFRTTVMLYARAEQAELVQGWNPLKCLAAEYVTRDWTGLPPACSTTYLFHLRWPDGTVTGEESAIAHDSVQKIFHHPFGYLWFSVFEVIELHLPFVDSWGHTYNQLATLGTFLLYVGMLLIGWGIRDRSIQFFLVVIGYTTLLFMFTDATPRYLMPSLFAYATVAGIGYDRFLQRFSRP